jgi:hypothetical protein
MRITEFLLARVDQEQSNAERVTAPRELGPDRSAAMDTYARRRAVIHRHHDQSVTVMATGEFQTVTRCGICIHEFTRPCRALKTLALPDRAHPDYDRAWDLAGSGAP